MKASNPYHLKDTQGGYFNKYPEFQIWEEGRQAGIKEAEHFFTPESYPVAVKVWCETCKGTGEVKYEGDRSGVEWERE